MQNSCINEKSEYAGFWVRLSAYVIDLLIICIPLLIIRLTVSSTTSVFEGTFLTKGILFQYTLTDIIVYLAQVIYFISCTYLTGMTIGKKLLNLKVVCAEEEQKLELIDVIYRETIGRFLNGLFCSLGYIFVGLDKEKRGFHDFLCDTRVIYTKKIKIYQTNPVVVQPVSDLQEPETQTERTEEMEIVEDEVGDMPQQIPQEEIKPEITETEPKKVQTLGGYTLVQDEDVEVK